MARSFHHGLDHPVFAEGFCEGMNQLGHGRVDALPFPPVIVLLGAEGEVLIPCVGVHFLQAIRNPKGPSSPYFIYGSGYP